MDRILNKYVDDEDLFGFHSEYYIDPRWRRYERYTSPNGERIVRKGYTCYSKYKDDIYFIPRNNEGCSCIIKSNVKQKTSCAIKLHTKRVFCDLEDYIAVNRQGYFLYNTRMITLFGFDGHEIYTHKFGQKDYVECVYIYDDKVIYSETKTAGISTQIYCINMLTKEKKRVWGTQKGDSVFDNQLRRSYELEWGTELPFFPTPSNIGNVSCEFLYANKHRVIAGYTRSKFPNYISYIINIDTTTNQWSILDCFPVGYNDHLPSEDDRRIFSFNMIDDTMWVKTNDADIRLVHTDIQRVAQLRGKYSVEWKLCKLQYLSYYYFNGKNAYIPENLELYRVEKNGEKNSINFHMYQTRYFWCLDDIYIIPNEYSTKYFKNIIEEDSSAYQLEKRDMEELIQSAELSRLEAVTEIKKDASEVSTYQEENNSYRIVNDSQMSLATFRQKAPSMTGFRDKLLSYRKSLHNRWDYNAYVGILLGVGGSKHGDAACMNYAIGQGDNGNNTKKTLAEKGLMSIFEKYKGRKIDETVMLSEVEDEIVAIVPEYEQIRQKLHEITKG